MMPPRYAGRVSTQDAAQVVVLTALPLEYDAVRRHLHNRVPRRHRVGTQFEVGLLTPGARVALAELGPGNLGAALVASHAIEMFQPKAIMFVGIAGALQQDLQLGDVVVATKVYSFQGGMATDDDFFARPQAYDAVSSSCRCPPSRAGRRTVQVSGFRSRGGEKRPRRDHPECE